MARPRSHRPGRLIALLGVAAVLAGCGGGGGEKADTAAPAESAGKTLFTQTADPACSSCHTLADAGASGTVGPNLDEAKPSKEKVLSALRQGPGAMPIYTGKLDPADAETLAEYVADVAGG